MTARLLLYMPANSPFLLHLSHPILLVKMILTPYLICLTYHFPSHLTLFLSVRCHGLAHKDILVYVFARLDVSVRVAIDIHILFAVSRVPALSIRVLPQSNSVEHLTFWLDGLLVATQMEERAAGFDALMLIMMFLVKMRMWNYCGVGKRVGGVPSIVTTTTTAVRSDTLLSITPFVFLLYRVSKFLLKFYRRRYKQKYCKSWTLLGPRRLPSRVVSRSTRPYTLPLMVWATSAR